MMIIGPEIWITLGNAAMALTSVVKDLPIIKKSFFGFKEVEVITYGGEVYGLLDAKDKSAEFKVYDPFNPEKTISPSLQIAIRNRNKSNSITIGSMFIGFPKSIDVSKCTPHLINNEKRWNSPNLEAVDQTYHEDLKKVKGFHIKNEYFIDNNLKILTVPPEDIRTVRLKWTEELQQDIVHKIILFKLQYVKPYIKKARAGMLESTIRYETETRIINFINKLQILVSIPSLGRSYSTPIDLYFKNALMLACIQKGIFGFEEFKTFGEEKYGVRLKPWRN